eukprot:scaffold59_cov77-Cylindrotheca_fusiformis.AAC.2
MRTSMAFFILPKVDWICFHNKAFSFFPPESNLSASNSRGSSLRNQNLNSTSRSVCLPGLTVSIQIDLRPELIRRHCCWLFRGWWCCWGSLSTRNVPLAATHPTGAGRPQRKYTAPEDVHSPTVSTEGLMTSLAIDAKERRYVVTADVEGAYLHADMDETVIMMFDDDMVDYMVETNPEKYGPHVHTNKYGKKRLYVQLLKALYGCMQSAMVEIIDIHFGGRRFRRQPIRSMRG